MANQTQSSPQHHHHHHGAIHSCLILIFLISLFTPTSSAQSKNAAADSDAQFDRATRLLRQATQPRPDGEHILLLRGLRQLHDPQLQSFFATLCQSDNPLIQVHALLESAALSDTKRIDPWKLSQLSRVELRRGALAEAISSDYVGIEEYQAVLNWPELDESIKSVALVMLSTTDAPPPIEKLTQLMAASNSPIVKARCALALRNLGHTTNTDQALAALDELPRTIRAAAIANLLGLIRSENNHQLTPWVKSLLTSENPSITHRLDIIRALLILDPEAGRTAWQETYIQAQGIANKLRAALVLLSMASHAKPADFAILENDDYELITAIGQTGAAVSAGSSAVEQCNQLLKFNHPISARWVLEHARTIKTANPEDAADLLEALIRSSVKKSRSMENRLELAVLASAILTKLDPPRLRTLLDETITDQNRLTQEAILAGAWQSRAPEAAQLIDEIPQWSSTRAGSLALLIKINYTNVGELKSDDLQRLTFIFGGAGHVSPGYQVQAAWLYLRHTQQEGPALASVLGGFLPKTSNNDDK